MRLPFFRRDGSGEEKPSRPHRPVVMYSTRYCGFCMRARRLLDDKQVHYQEIMVDGDGDLWREMEEKSGRRTVPQIFIDGIAIGGCNELYALDRSGELDTLLFADLEPPDSSAG